jgi:hypothetical protein
VNESHKEGKWWFYLFNLLPTFAPENWGLGRRPFAGSKKGQLVAGYFSRHWLRIECACRVFAQVRGRSIALSLQSQQITRFNPSE